MTARHLAVITEGDPSLHHGAEQALLLAGQLAERGHRVSLLCVDQSAGAPPAGVEVHKLACRRMTTARGMLFYQRWVRQALAQLQPEYTISMTTLADGDIVVPSAGTMAGYTKCLRSLRAPLPVRAGAVMRTIAPALTLARSIERRVLIDAHVRAIVADNTMIADELLAMKQVDAARVHTLDPIRPLDTIAEGTAAHLRQQFARGLGLDESSAWVLFPFQSAWIDGIEPLVLAFKSLIDHGGRAALLLAGPWRYTLLSWIAQLGLREHVRFLGTPDDPGPLVAAADLVVQPTAYDPGGRWALRALSQGRPIITTEACGASSWVRAAQGTVLPALPDPADLARGMAQAIEKRTGAATETAPPGPEPPPPLARAQAIEALLAG